MTALLKIHGERVLADSRDVAAAFAKRHDNVLRAIDRLLAMRPDLLGLNFEEMVVRVDIGSGASRRARAMAIDRTGFLLLVMGFTGSRALAIKIEWARAFEQMEARLRARAANDTASLYLASADDVARSGAIVAEVATATTLYGEAGGRLVWERAGKPVPGAVGALAALPAPPASPLDAWLRARVERAPGARSRTRDLYADYLAHCAGRGAEPVNARNFAGELDRAGAPSVKASVMYRSGIRLRS